MVDVAHQLDILPEQVQYHILEIEASKRDSLEDFDQRPAKGFVSGWLAARTLSFVPKFLVKLELISTRRSR